ncbi:NADP oxidoreductase [bacterium]|nr:NADP oxidoreductase [bacterium]
MTIGTESRPLRVAVVGAGPSGFYAADALFKSPLTVSIDAFDRLPTPFGLLRGGVAPDHQKMKSVGAYYERVATANEYRFRFFGNVAIGTDITIDELRTYYDAIIVSMGAQSDRKLGIPGEDLPGVHAATEFVGWYNGHPDYQHLTFDLSQETVVVVGQGNVAIDVTRILAKPISELRKTDIPEAILDQLAKSKVKNIHLVGRRGPVQSAFTELEIKEFGELEGCKVVIDPADMVLNAESETELNGETNTKARKNMAVLRHYVDEPKADGDKTVTIRFLESPVEIQGVDRVARIVLEKNTLTGEAGKQQATGTGTRVELDAGLVFKSIGYKGVAMPGMPFDEKSGTIPNTKGQVGNDPALYVAGWIKRGPKGVLGTNKPCSTETIETLLANVDQMPGCASPDPTAVEKLLEQRRIQWVSYADWKVIDQIEKEHGEKLGKPREKFTSAGDILSILRRVNA